MVNNIRNFVVISHVDHGKSTLADRFLELTNTVPKTKMRAQYLDQMDLERERGITIKMAPVTMLWQLPKHSELSTFNFQLSTPEVVLNLIDTPGHMDFAYEVERSLAAVEGVILLIDVSQGVQAQTLAHLQLAARQGLAVLPAINKIDLPCDEVAKARVMQEVIEMLKRFKVNALVPPLQVSGKTGAGVEQLLQTVVSYVPAPQNPSGSTPLKALVFDSRYDPYKGVIAYVRIFQGSVRRGMRIKFWHVGTASEVQEVGLFKPHLVAQETLAAGAIGYIATGLKDIGHVRVGDSITLASATQENFTPLPGYREAKPVVFANIFPREGNDFVLLRSTVEKFQLNDAALHFEPIAHPAFGRGIRAGFLGTLHMEIVVERLKREYNLEVVVTSPSVVYKIKQHAKPELLEVYAAAELPDPSTIERIFEPWVKLEVLAPISAMNQVFELAKISRAVFKSSEALSNERVEVTFEIPLAEIIEGFIDDLKSATAGYGSMSYTLLDYRPASAVKLDILVAGEPAGALARIMHADKAYGYGRRILLKLKEVLARQQFKQSLQARIGGKVIAREDIPAMRKDVTGYLYGGDYTRKRKLLEKQKRGKKKLRALGRVRIPESVYLALLKR